MHTDNLNAQLCVSPLMAQIQRHLDSHMTGGKDWPADAEFAVVYNHSTWPCGWGDESHVEFFTSEDDMQKWVARQHDWAKCEDNYVAYQVYEWDLGPQRRYDLAFCTGNLCMTYQEKLNAGLIRSI
jgi:hypothetical protein